MFSDLFGPSFQQLEDSHLHHATNFLALAMLLIEKGVITDEELDRTKTQATHLIDQLAAQKKEEATAESELKR